MFRQLSNKLLIEFYSSAADSSEPIAAIPEPVTQAVAKPKKLMSNTQIRAALFAKEVPTAADEKPSSQQSIQTTIPPLTNRQIRAALFGDASKSRRPILFHKPAEVEGAIFIDCDQTIVDYARYRDESGKLELTEHLINIVKWRELNQYAIENNYALYILTARKDSMFFIHQIASYIERAEGFRPTLNARLGGFNYLSKDMRDEIEFLQGRDKIIRKAELNDFVFFTKNPDGEIVLTKSEIIELVHQIRFPGLAKSKIIFIDNLTEEINPVKACGYPTILAELNGSHFHIVLELLKTFALMMSPQLMAVEPTENTSTRIAIKM